jgi:hypothetical protein
MYDCYRCMVGLCPTGRLFQPCITMLHHGPKIRHISGWHIDRFYDMSLNRIWTWNRVCTLVCDEFK